MTLRVNPHILQVCRLGALALMLALAAGPVGAQTAADQPDDLEILAPDVAPELETFIEADYPADALRQGLEGTVLLEMLVTATGAVDSVFVVTGLTPELDAAATVAAKQFVFKPAMAEGEPVPVYVQFEYTFSISEQTRRIAEYVNFRGRLKEMGTRQPLEGAMVVVTFPNGGREAQLDVPWQAYLERIGDFGGQFLEEDRIVTFTDSTGHFSLKSLPAGQIDLSFPNAGYEILQTSETINADELIDATYWLKRSRYNEYEIVVYGRGEEKEVSRQTLSVTEVERIAGFGGDVIKSLQALPGVARPTMEDPGAVVVRGSGNYDTRFFLDGVDIPLLFHYGGLKSTYNSLALGSVDLYPGGFGTQYGGCVGGVVELKGRGGRDDRWHTVLDASLLDASFHTEGPLGKGFNLLLTGRRSYVGEIADMALKNNDNVKMAMAPYYWDLVGRLDYGKNTNHHLFLTAFMAKDRMSMVVPDAAEGSPEVNAAIDEISMDIKFSRFIFGYDAQLSDRATNELRLAYGRNRESFKVLGHFRFEGKSPYYQIRDDLAYKWSDKVISHVGADAVFVPYDYEVKANGWPSSIQDKKFSDTATYANVELRPTKHWLITPGVRYDYYQHIKKGELAARVSSRYQYHPDRTITASYGSYNQAPQPIGQSTDPVYGNPDLPPTTAIQATLGHEWRINDRLSLKVEGYYNTQKDIPAMTDSLDLNFVPDEEARMYGIEFMLRHESNENFFGWISYSLGRSERKFARRPDPNLGDEWNPNTWFYHNMDQTHHVEAVGSWQLGNNWSFGARVQYVSGVPVTPNLSYTSNQYEFNADTGEYDPVPGEYYSDRMSPYFRTDLRIDKKYIKKNSIWSVYLDLQNANYFLYNSPEGYTENYDYSKRTEYGWIFMPALGCRVEF